MKGYLLMEAVEAARELYIKASNMTTSELTELLDNAQTPEEKDFYFVIYNTILQQKQKKVIQANIY